MDLAILQQVALELNELLPGGFVNKIYQPLPREIVLRVRGPGGEQRRLMLSADPLLGRLHLTDLKIPNPPSPPRFCAYLRAHFQGSMITGVACNPHDRVVSITAVRGPREGGSRRKLILELLGRDSNIILVDGSSNFIMECLHRIPRKETGNRSVLPGDRYQAPPKGKRQFGASVLNSEPKQLSPGIAIGSDGRRRLTLHAEDSGDEVFESMNLAADAFFAPRVSAVLLEGFRRDMARPLTARIHALDRRILKIEGDMARAQQFMERQEEGELLKANLSHVKKGTKRIEVEDWYKGGKRIIELDPALDAVANMERIFKRAAKGKRGEKIVQERLRETLEEKAALQDLLFFVEAAQNLEELNRLAPEIPAFLTKGRPESPAEKNRKQEASAGLYRTFRTPGGLVVFVGRSARGNDSLIREKARKGDLWFHAKGTPGAHVLLPVRGEGSPTEKDKEFAAGLAVYFSKARGKGKTEVIVADVKDIGHPKGAASGQVTVRKYATIVSEGSEEL